MALYGRMIHQQENTLGVSQLKRRANLKETGGVKQVGSSVDLDIRLTECLLLLTNLRLGRCARSGFRFHWGPNEFP